MTVRTLTLTAPDSFPEVRPGDSLLDMICDAFVAEDIAVQDGDVLVVAQKIVSKAEGQIRRLNSISPSRRARGLAEIAEKDPRIVELVLSESENVLRCRPGVLIVRDKRGYVLANAGIDASNVMLDHGEEAVLLLPADPDKSASLLHRGLTARFRVRIGVVINDSWGRAWRNGTVGTALGVAGMPGLLDLRGKPDRQGRKLMSTELAVADEIAAAASLLMGQAGEGRPVVLVRGFPYTLRDGSAQELIRPIQRDLFQ